MTIRAVIFDLGGVLYPFRDYEQFRAQCQKAKSCPETRRKLDGWHDGSLSTLDVKDFFEQTFGKLPKNVEDLENVKLTDFMGPKHDKIYRYIENLKRHGIKVALLTNNGWWTPNKAKSVIMEDLTPFDVVVESCKEGIYKPNPEIFQRALNKLGVEAKECAFVDDLEGNIRSAASLGINTIQMINQDQDLTISKLEKLLNVPAN